MSNLVSVFRAQWPFTIETALVLAAFLVAILKPDLGSSLFTKLERLAGTFARKRRLTVLAVILLALVVRGALLLVDPIPSPGIHDEFSYLLMADTFASGHLTNPTHPMWKHFETFQVNQQPTYCSKYPVAQGLTLAAGQALLGHPWFGVWISVALMCGAICWMLQAWLPPGWAMLGGLLAVMRLGLFSYWIDSYWGGAVAAVGGCLALGALGRMRSRITVSDAVWMGVGASILANSRPFEGLLVVIGIGVTLLVWIAQGECDWRVFLRRGALPMLIPVSFTAILTGVYFHATTGSPFISPYQVYNRTYGIVPLPNWIWLSLLPVADYRHPVMKLFYTTWEAPVFLQGKSISGFVMSHILLRMKQAIWFFWGPALSVAMLAAWGLIRDRRIRPLLGICVFFAAGQSLQPFFNIHYAAPVTGALMALVLQAFRHLRCWRPAGEPVGRFLVRAVPMICLLMGVVRLAHPPAPNEWNRTRPDIWCCAEAGNLVREEIISRLTNLGGSHLVLVHYGPQHNFHHEWVYNAADIDASPVVFARDMDPASDRELIEYFKNRTVWVLAADGDSPLLTRYQGSEAAR